METHELKLAHPYFDHVRLGFKTFELRKNDRDFKVGDILILKEINYVVERKCWFDHDKGEWRENIQRSDEMKFTGKKITARIAYILEDYQGLETGYCILGIEVI